MLVDKVNNGCEDAEPFVIGNLTIAKRYWSEDAHLLYKHLQRIFITFERNIGWLKYVPIVAPYQANQLKKSQDEVSQYQWLWSLTVAPNDQTSVGAFQRRFSIASGLRKIAAPMT